MSTTATTDIPDVNSVTTQSGGKSWRPAHGKFVRGQEIVEQATSPSGTVTEVKTGRYPEEVTKVLGRLRRVGIHMEGGDGRYGPQHRFDVDIETSTGPMCISVSMLDPSGAFKVGVSALNLAWCCLQYGKDDLVMLETALGEPATLPNGSKGGRPTYVNCFKVEGTTATPIYRPKRDKNAPRQSAEDQWRELEPQILAHPAYAERPAAREDDPETGEATTHLSALCKECLAKGWPSPEQAPSEWLAMAAKFVGASEPKAALSGHSDSEWGEIRLAVKDKTDLPSGLVDAAKRLSSAPAPAHDPFA